MQQRHHAPFGRGFGGNQPVNPLDQQRVLGNRVGKFANGLPIPAGDKGETMGDVLDLDIQGRGVEQIKPAAGKHALIGAGGH